MNTVTWSGGGRQPRLPPKAPSRRCWLLNHPFSSIQFSSVQSLSHVRLFVTPWTAARQASLSFTISLSLFQLTSIESVMPPNHLILCRPLLLPPSIFPSIRVFSNESVLHIRWPGTPWLIERCFGGYFSFEMCPDLTALLSNLREPFNFPYK